MRIFFPLQTFDIKSSQKIFQVDFDIFSIHLENFVHTSITETMCLENCHSKLVTLRKIKKI